MKKSKPHFAPKYYSDLEAPVFVWNKVHETGDLSWLLLKRIPKITKALAKKLTQVWENIYDEYIKEFGWSNEYIEIQEKEIEVRQLVLEHIKTEDRVLLTEIQIARQELSAMQAKQSKGNFTKNKHAIEKSMGFHLNLKEVSIREFYDYLKALRKK